ncbi:DUF262 and DUF1524 domain-containing protein [Deinococcus depolymerans]|uniref:DUF262 domain-containing protein n=1 Tax=Deinococcus depolymerans TaxID=392408 RepID=A0ABN1CCW9_9DEIO
MIAEQARLAELLHGSKQFEVPLYQRPYSWGTSEREQFWRDILRIGQDARSTMHFTGSVVFMERTGSMAGNLKRARLIDGQQRLTTLTLLMLAVSERLARDGELAVPLDGTSDMQQIGASDVREDYLFNKRLTGDSRYKLLPTHSDRDTLKALMESGQVPLNESKAILAGVAFFREKLADPALDLRVVLRGVHKLQVVTVALEEGRDDPQLIFESLNSTGKDLTQADLIRNNVLMGLRPEEQDELSRDFWVPMELRFASLDGVTFDRFMRDYLTLRTRSIPNEQEVYAAFKAFRAARPEGENVQVLVADVARLAKLYMGIVHPEQLADEKVRLAMEDLLALRVGVVSPFLLEVLEDHALGRLTDADLERVLRLLESFLLRRAVLGERTAPLNRFFAALGRELEKAEYVRSLERALVRFQDRDQDGFPSDEAFVAALKTASIYRMNVCKPLLVRLERGHSPKEAFENDTLTIEHVMPQNNKADSLSGAWQTMLGSDWPEVQRRLVHTLGNLTLTGYNSELGDRPFVEKQSLPAPKGYRHSRMLMTRKLADLPEWNEARIQARAEELAQQALSLWSFPAFTPEEVQALRAEGRQRGATRTVEDYFDNASPALRQLFAQVRERLLGLDGRVTETANRAYVAYKAGSNFCDLVPLTSQDALKCWLNLPPDDVDDPLHLTRNVAGRGRAGNGELEVTLTVQSDLMAFEALAQQALAYQLSRQDGASSQAAGETVSFAHLPAEAQQVLEDLQTRTLGLGSVTATDRRFYRSFRNRRVFMEIYPRQAALHLSVRFTPSAESEVETTGWRQSNVWLSRSVATRAELDAAWPVVMAAFADQEEGGTDGAVQASVTNAQYRLARQVFDELKTRGAVLADDVEAQVTQKSARFSVMSTQGPLEFMRVISSASTGRVEVKLNVEAAQLQSPQGFGRTVAPGDETAGFTPGHFEATVVRLEEVETVLELARQAYEALRA